MFLVGILFIGLGIYLVSGGEISKPGGQTYVVEGNYKLQNIGNFVQLSEFNSISRKSNFVEAPGGSCSSSILGILNPTNVRVNMALCKPGGVSCQVQQCNIGDLPIVGTGKQIDFKFKGVEEGDYVLNVKVVWDGTFSEQEISRKFDIEAR